MTNHVVRLYAAAASLLVFFLAWAGIAARPWPAAKPDPALAALALREQRLQEESIAVKKLLDRRWSAYRAAVAARRRAVAARQAQQRLATTPKPAAPPSVRVVTLPPLTMTRSS
jgi:hypothetical protein